MGTYPGLLSLSSVVPAEGELRAAQNLTPCSSRLEKVRTYIAYSNLDLKDPLAFKPHIWAEVKSPPFLGGYLGNGTFHGTLICVIRFQLCRVK